jgi:hypothetical protein
MLLGKVQARDNTEGLQIIIDGEDEPTTKKYHYLASYVPSAGDRILIEEIGDSYVVLGKVIDQYSSSGIVRKATNADNATNADKADKATSASSATNATNATNATYTNYVKSYSGSYNIQFTYYNGNIWAKIGSTQFALAKG